jgi:hypothetical protein
VVYKSLIKGSPSWCSLAIATSNVTQHWDVEKYELYLILGDKEAFCLCAKHRLVIYPLITFFNFALTQKMVNAITNKRNI